MFLQVFYHSRLTCSSSLILSSTSCLFFCLLPLKLVLSDSLLYTVFIFVGLMPLVFSYACAALHFGFIQGL